MVSSSTTKETTTCAKSVKPKAATTRLITQKTIFATAAKRTIATAVFGVPASPAIQTNHHKTNRRGFGPATPTKETTR